MSNIHRTSQECLDEVSVLKERIAHLEASEVKRKRAELTLRAAAEEWEQSFNALTDEVMILDKSGIVLWANKAVRDCFEESHGNLLGLDYRLLYYGTLHPDVRPPWDSVLHGALSAAVEVSLPKLQGWFSVACYPLYDIEGKQWGAISITKDITDRRRVEEALRDIAQGAPAAGGAAFFRALAKDLSKALDVQYAFLAEFPDSNQGTAHTVAVCAQGQFADNFSWDMVNSPGPTILHQNTPCWGQEVQRHYPSDLLLAKWNINSFIGIPLVNSMGKNIGLIVAMDPGPLRNLQLAQSILGVFAVRAASELERKRAEEALRDNEERYRAIAEHAYDLIFEIQSNGSLLYLSPSCGDVLGHDLKEFRQYNFLDLLHPDDQSLINPDFENKICSLHDWQMECRLHHQSGEWRWFESHIKPFRTTTGDIVAVVVSRDITERRRIDEERLRSTKLESISILAGGIAHDFNNILTAVFANVGLAKMLSSKDGSASNPAIGERLSAAEKACMRARDLTKQLLTFSKGGTPVKNCASISSFINETAEFALRGSNVRCDLALPDHLWSVEVDEGQMSQVIQNLIINADHAMPDGGVIQIQAENLALDASYGLPIKSGQYVKVSIHDQGTGIHPDHLPKIFDPYFTTKQKGSGLGLATTYSIVKRHEGHIAVHSDLGIGTTFEFYLPATDQCEFVINDASEVYEALPLDAEATSELIDEFDGQLSSIFRKVDICQNEIRCDPMFQFLHINKFTQEFFNKKFSIARRYPRGSSVRELHKDPEKILLVEESIVDQLLEEALNRRNFVVIRFLLHYELYGVHFSEHNNIQIPLEWEQIDQFEIPSILLTEEDLEDLCSPLEGLPESHSFDESQDQEILFHLDGEYVIFHLEHAIRRKDVGSLRAQLKLYGHNIRAYQPYNIEERKNSLEDSYTCISQDFI